ncbi:hypothetical protein Gohar_018856 [Gossypium harknessii]|uniref:Uncharacterized protein n=1 Tax=Gossypium harknessii TaxID=34285 RepID=A0A7J9GAF3_9ROSI|nr:hypothetical protein [Gossypium harknessii]
MYWIIRVKVQYNIMRFHFWLEIFWQFRYQLQLSSRLLAWGRKLSHL